MQPPAHEQQPPISPSLPPSPKNHTYSKETPVEQGPVLFNDLVQNTTAEEADKPIAIDRNRRKGSYKKRKKLRKRDKRN